MFFEPYYTNKNDKSNEESGSRNHETTTGPFIDDTKLIFRNTPAGVQVPFFVATKEPKNNC